MVIPFNQRNWIITQLQFGKYKAVVIAMGIDPAKVMVVSELYETVLCGSGI